jgi:hypothetical protein
MKPRDCIDRVLVHCIADDRKAQSILDATHSSIIKRQRQKEL